MNFHLIAAALVLVVLTGCSQTMDFVHGDWLDDETDNTAVPATVSVAPSQSVATTANAASFCQSVATSDKSISSFDATTQKRMMTQSFQQCLALFGGER